MRTITIDDRRSIVNMMLRILNQIDPKGEHIGTTDPDEVIRELKKKKATAVFTDVEMPKMNGIDLANCRRSIRRSTSSSLPVIRNTCRMPLTSMPPAI